MDNIQEEIDASEISESDLGEVGWERVCGNLTRHHALQIIATHPDQVIVKDELNEWMWVVMKKKESELSNKGGDINEDGSIKNP